MWTSRRIHRSRRSWSRRQWPHSRAAAWSSGPAAAFAGRGAPGVGIGVGVSGRIPGLRRGPVGPAAAFAGRGAPGVGIGVWPHSRAAAWSSRLDQPPHSPVAALMARRWRRVARRWRN